MLMAEKNKKEQNLNKADELKWKSIYLNFDLQKADNSDDDSREVWGIASAEVIDSYWDIVKHEAMKAAWDDYMKYANIREMHWPSAVWTVIDYEFLDDQKATFIKVKVVDDMAWNKVKEWVYKWFSIWARILDASWEVVDWEDYFAITKLELVEISLVDRPACPEANIDWHKFYSITPKDMNLFKFLKEDKEEVKKNDEVHPEVPEVPETPETLEVKTEPETPETPENDEAKKSDNSETLKSISDTLEVVKSQLAEQKTFNENLVKSLEGAFEQVFKSNDTETIKSQMTELQKSVKSLKKADSAQKDDEPNDEVTKSYQPKFSSSYGWF